MELCGRRSGGSLRALLEHPLSVSANSSVGSSSRHPKTHSQCSARCVRLQHLQRRRARLIGLCGGLHKTHTHPIEPLWTLRTRPRQENQAVLIRSRQARPIRQTYCAYKEVQGIEDF